MWYDASASHRRASAFVAGPAAWRARLVAACRRCDRRRCPVRVMPLRDGWVSTVCASNQVSRCPRHTTGSTTTSVAPTVPAGLSSSQRHSLLQIWALGRRCRSSEAMSATGLPDPTPALLGTPQSIHVVQPPATGQIVLVYPPSALVPESPVTGCRRAGVGHAGPHRGGLLPEDARQHVNGPLRQRRWQRRLLDRRIAASVDVRSSATKFNRTRCGWPPTPCCGSGVITSIASKPMSISKLPCESPTSIP